MEKISAYTFEFPNGIMYFVGSERAINDLHNNFLIQQESHNGIDLSIWYERIIPNRIYGCFEPKNLHGITVLIPFYFKMKKHGLWISGARFSEALYLANQEEAGKILGLTEEDAAKIKAESTWKGIFSY